LDKDLQTISHNVLHSPALPKFNTHINPNINCQIKILNCQKAPIQVSLPNSLNKINLSPYPNDVWIQETELLALSILVGLAL